MGSADPFTEFTTLWLLSPFALTAVSIHSRSFDIIPGPNAPPFEEACERGTLEHPAAGSGGGERRPVSRVSPAVRASANGCMEIDQAWERPG